MGLSQIDNRPDADTLAAVGAPLWVQRRSAFWLAMIVGGTGAVLGGGIALIPVIALNLPGSPLPFAPPWLPILALVIVGIHAQQVRRPVRTTRRRPERTSRHRTTGARIRAREEFVMTKVMT